MELRRNHSYFVPESPTLNFDKSCRAIVRRLTGRVALSADLVYLTRMALFFGSILG
jgi:hypothetical protein